MKRLSKIEARKLNPKVRIPLWNLPAFIAGIKSRNITVFGFTDANNIDCVGMSYYLIWRDNHGTFATATNDSQINRIESETK